MSGALMFRRYKYIYFYNHLGIHMFFFFLFFFSFLVWGEAEFTWYVGH
jgi:hypothetical protein